MELAEIEELMNKAVQATQRSFNTVRTGRANSSLLDRIQVEYYGVPTPLKALASLTTPDSSTLLIQPFDPSTLAAIERAIVASDLGLTPSNDGKVVRLTIPPDGRAPQRAEQTGGQASRRGASLDPQHPAGWHRLGAQAREKWRAV